MNDIFRPQLKLIINPGAPDGFRARRLNSEEE